MFTFLGNLAKDLMRRPLRTVLTISGVVWGTFSVVLLLAFGDGVAKNNQKTFRGLGQGMVICFPGRTTMPYKGFTKGRPVRVTPEEVLQISKRIPGIKYACPEFIRRMRIRYKKSELRNAIRGVNPEFEIVRNTIPAKGRFINIKDVESKRRVCLLGDTVATDLFGKEEPVGKQISVEGVPFLVVGVMIEKEQDSTYSGGRDKYGVFIPYTTFMSLYGSKYVSNFIVQPHDPMQSVYYTKRVREFLGNRIGFDPADKDAMFVWDFAEFERQFGGFFTAFNIFLGMIGSFTLLVGGVGVASIMLVVVEERIKEIGVKLAIGAKRRRILSEFFIESLVIILFGGAVGFAMAAGLIAVIPVDQIKDFVGIPKIDPSIGIITISILLVIGAISGIMPARRAASTDPVEALRS